MEQRETKSTYTVYTRTYSTGFIFLGDVNAAMLNEAGFCSADFRAFKIDKNHSIYF